MYFLAAVAGLCALGSVSLLVRYLVSWNRDCFFRSRKMLGNFILVVDGTLCTGENNTCQNPIQFNQIKITVFLKKEFQISSMPDIFQ